MGNDEVTVGEKLYAVAENLVVNAENPTSADDEAQVAFQWARDGDGSTSYGFSTANSIEAVDNWQYGLTFENLSDSETYFFFAKVSGGANYSDALSFAKAVKIGHKWNLGVETKPASCSCVRVMTYICELCADTYDEDISKLAHKTELVNEKPATCSEVGSTGDIICTVCGEIISAHGLIPVTDHTDEDNDGLCDFCNISIDTNDTNKDVIARFIDLIFRLIRMLRKFLRLNSGIIVH